MMSTHMPLKMTNIVRDTYDPALPHAPQMTDLDLRRKTEIAMRALVSIPHPMPIGGLLMPTQTFKEISFRNTGLLSSEIQTVHKDDGQASAVMRGAAIRPNRRREPRLASSYWCSYGSFKSVDGERIVFEHGEAWVLNHSTKGVLLFMGHAPYLNQFIQAAIPGSLQLGRRSIVNVYEVRWIRPVPVETQGTLYLAGCRRTFNP